MKETFLRDNYGTIKLQFVLIFVFVPLILCVSIFIYYDWFVSEQVLNSLTCEELSYSIKNKEPESQMIWHYNDRCI